jgi:hypothetical protein
MHVFFVRGRSVIALSLLSLVALLLTAGGLPIPHVPLRLVQNQAPPPNIYYGVHATSWLDNLGPVTTFERDAHKSVSIVMWYQGWGLTQGQNFEPTWMNNVRDHGSIPMISWEPQDYTKGVNQPTYSLQNIISGKLDGYITKWAQASKAWRHPYFLRFAAEMNGYWFPWSELTNGNKAGQYVQAWRHVHDIFTKQGATNVTWVWSPNIVFPGNIPLQELYPGSSYVDWVGIDGYNWGSIGRGHQPQSFSQIFQKTYTILVGMSLHKPMMIAETGSTNQQVNKAAWITDAFSVQLPKNFPEVKAFVWFNQNKETDWRIESSASAQTAFANAMASSQYAANSYASLNVSPIPIPQQAAALHR